MSNVKQNSQKEMNYYLLFLVGLLAGVVNADVNADHYFRLDSRIAKASRRSHSFSVRATAFPTHPKYAYIKYFRDSSCSGNSSYVESVLLDTCLWSGGLTYYKFVCGKLYIGFVFILSYLLRFSQ
jgi:hypothetical protein